MLKKLFDKFTGSASTAGNGGKPSVRSGAGSGAGSEPPWKAPLLDAITERRKVDPLVGPKLASQEIKSRVLHALNGERGVHAESLVCALGALSGYACQASLREMARERGQDLSTIFMIVRTKDGRPWFFGDPLNNLLVGPGLSVWGFAAGAAQHAGCDPLPDYNGIFAYNSQVLGTPEFGIPRLPEGHSVGDLPVNYVKAFWPALLPLLRSMCATPAEWPIAYSMALQLTLDMCKGTLEPGLALTIAMESAVPMSKVDLDTA